MKTKTPKRKSAPKRARAALSAARIPQLVAVIKQLERDKDVLFAAAQDWERRAAEYRERCIKDRNEIRDHERARDALRTWIR